MRARQVRQAPCKCKAVASVGRRKGHAGPRARTRPCAGTPSGTRRAGRCWPRPGPGCAAASAAPRPTRTAARTRPRTTSGTGARARRPASAGSRAAWRCPACLRAQAQVSAACLARPLAQVAARQEHCSARAWRSTGRRAAKGDDICCWARPRRTGSLQAGPQRGARGARLAALRRVAGVALGRRDGRRGRAGVQEVRWRGVRGGQLRIRRRLRIGLRQAAHVAREPDAQLPTL